MQPIWNLSLEITVNWCGLGKCNRLFCKVNRYESISWNINQLKSAAVASFSCLLLISQAWGLIRMAGGFLLGRIQHEPEGRQALYRGANICHFLKEILRVAAPLNPPLFSTSLSFIFYWDCGIIPTLFITSWLKVYICWLSFGKKF